MGSMALLKYPWDPYPVVHVDFFFSSILYLGCRGEREYREAQAGLELTL